MAGSYAYSPQSPAPPVTDWCYEAAVGNFIPSGSSVGILCLKINWS